MFAPFQRLLKSAKFWMASLAFGKTLLLTYMDIDIAVIASLDALLLVVIGGMAYEDGKEKEAMGNALANTSDEMSTQNVVDAFQPYRKDLPIREGKEGF